MKYCIPNLLLALALTTWTSSAQPIAPSLGAASGFELFAADALGITGLSKITGNIGSRSGAVSVATNINGRVVAANSAESIAVASSVLLAFTELDGALATDTIANAMGNDDTLNAGVHVVAGNATIDDTLYLDGQSAANAAFIFKIQGGTLSSFVNAKVVLLNGAQACNVFWKVDGAVSLVAGTTMRGTIIANSNLINMATGSVLEGRLFTSTAGAITVDGVLAYVPTGCGMPALTGPPAPALASTACYALFTTDGYNNNNGISNITGDVGANTSGTAGYDPLLVNGTIHTLPDLSTAACAADLGTVATYLNNLTADIDLLYPAQLGNSLVLTPHTYHLGGGTVLTDTLFLDAQGNPDGVFVLQIDGGALTTSTYATIVLLNGAQAKNVFWQVDLAVSIANFSRIKGTIVNGGAISLGTDVNIEGRALTTVGLLTANAVNVAITTPPCSIAPLPLGWLYFRARPVANEVSLEWSTAKENTGAYFTIEKSRDARYFEMLSTVATSFNDSQSEQHYDYTDRQPFNRGYYRIAQTDNNGKKTYTQTVEVNIVHKVKALSYVEGNSIYVQVFGAGRGNSSIELYSVDGKKAGAQKIELTEETGLYRITKPQPGGMYIIIIKRDNEQIFEEKIMID